MSGVDPEVARARAAADAARLRLAATLAELQARLSPRVLVKDAIGGVREQSAKAVEQVREQSAKAVDHARAHPGVTAGAATAATLLLLRRPLGRAARRLFFGRKETRDGDDPLIDPTAAEHDAQIPLDP